MLCGTRNAVGGVLRLVVAFADDLPVPPPVREDFVPDDVLAILGGHVERPLRVGDVVSHARSVQRRAVETSRAWRRNSRGGRALRPCPGAVLRCPLGRRNRRRRTRQELPTCHRPWLWPRTLPRAWRCLWIGSSQMPSWDSPFRLSGSFAGSRRHPMRPSAQLFGSRGRAGVSSARPHLRLTPA